MPTSGVHPLWFRGDTFACGRGGGGSQFGRGDRHCGTLGIYVRYFVMYIVQYIGTNPAESSDKDQLLTSRPEMIIVARYEDKPKENRDGILEQHFQSKFLGINWSLLRLEFLSGFLPSFFSTKCYS